MVGILVLVPSEMKVGMCGYLCRRLAFWRVRDHSNMTKGVTILGFGKTAEVCSMFV